MKKTTSKRSRGRPASIDRDAVLDRAVTLFWKKGVEGASLGDLTEAMGVSRPTLYALWGDKASLFDAVLNRYIATVGAAPMAAFDAEADIHTAVTAFLRTSAEGNTALGQPAGCLIGCCATTAAGSDPNVRGKVADILSATTNRLADRFSYEIEAGVLKGNPTAAERATLMVDLMNGQAVRARAGMERKALLEGIDTRAALVLA